MSTSRAPVSWCAEAETLAKTSGSVKLNLDIFLAGEIYKMTKHIWNRPDLPQDKQGGGLNAGALLLVTGGVLLLWGPTQFDGGVVVAVGASLVSFSIFVFSVSLILREIRQVAFESALRAGEVTLGTPEKTNPRTK